MLSVLDILKNISKGQTALKTSSIKKDLDTFYEKVRSKIQIKHVLLDGPATQIYFKLPATDYPLFYDVVILFNTVSRITTSTLIKVYSNSPNFAFNYCYLFFRERSLLFPDKYPSIFLTDPPKIRNPLEIKAFDKHIYACLRYVSKMNLTELSNNYQGNPEPTVKSFDEKMEEIKKTHKEMKELKASRGI